MSNDSQSKDYASMPGRGSLKSNIKKHAKSPDYFGYLITKKDYKAGEKIKLSGWKYANDYGEIISLSENLPETERFRNEPREIKDEDIPF